MSARPPSAPARRRPPQGPGGVLTVLTVLGVLFVAWKSRHRAPPASNTTPPARASASREEPLPLSSAAPSVAPIERTVRDRSTRDAVRDAIARAWSLEPRVAPAPSATASTTPGASALSREPRFVPMPELPNGAVDPDYIRERIREDFLPLAQSCFAQLRARAPASRGTALMHFVLLGDEHVGGVVDEVTLVVRDAGAPLGDEAFATCLRESMMAMAFRPPPRSGRLDVTYPFQFEPDEDAPDGGT